MSGVVAAVAAMKKGGVVISAGPGGNHQDIAVFPSDALCELTFESDGDINVSGFGGDIGDWMSPKLGEPASNYEIMATVTSGALSGGSPTGTWLLLNTSRNWYVQETGAGTRTVTLSIQIRRAADQVVLSTVSYTLDAIVEV